MTETWDSLVERAKMYNPDGGWGIMGDVKAIMQGVYVIERLKASLADAERDRDEAQVLMDRAVRALADQIAAPLRPDRESLVARIVAALCWEKYRDDSNEDSRWIAARYEELKGRNSFDDSARMARVEWLSMVLQDAALPVAPGESGEVES